ncbi:XRE family transcriptional regulator [Vibrio sp. 10N.286.49.B3]|uniref:sugar diacid recognition domain-containing protein n=1 Tax=Vibrio sp. 10N.286.49.B3 TaxID=1880855 RepID=UPI000C83FFD0|nr:sugar diacid recognition domain-containing protein [Vibrio sp. 10N.286.49.B3]PMH43844.1 XRE family transcriptional regulator [Vibrio sp. 10N.286.49.B3]
MQINEAIARRIVERAMKIISYSINVMDAKGRIIGSGDSSRLYEKHEGAILAINENRIVEIGQSTTSYLKGVKPGINLPIVYQDLVIGVVGISGTPDTVRHYGELVKMTAELIVEQAALMAQVQWNKRHREELLLQLIQGSTLNEEQLNSIAERLDLDLSQPRIATVVKVIPAKDTALSLEHLQQLVHLLEFPERDNLVGIISVSHNEVVVLKPISLTASGWSQEIEDKRIKQLLKRIKKEGNFTIKIALGDYFPTLNGLAKSYQTAKLTMKAAHKKPGSVFFYQDYKLPVLLNSVKQEQWQYDQLRKPYTLLEEHDHKGVLIKTLTQYFEQNCDVSQTCQCLHIHRNTLRYRMDKIESLTGLKFNNLMDVTHLYLSLSLI